MQRMFERFTDRSRRILVLAQEEARLDQSDYIGTEHLLLGMIHESEGIAGRVLARLEVDLEQVRKVVATWARPPRPAAPAPSPPFTPRCRKVLELALREALQLGHNYIGTEHILLGLIREGEGVGAQVLVQECHLSLSQVRSEVIQVLSGYEPSPSQVVTVPMARQLHTEMLAWIETFDKTNGPLAERHVLARLRAALNVAS